MRETAGKNTNVHLHRYTTHTLYVNKNISNQHGQHDQVDGATNTVQLATGTVLQQLQTRVYVHVCVCVCVCLIRMCMYNVIVCVYLFIVDARVRCVLCLRAEGSHQS